MIPHDGVSCNYTQFQATMNFRAKKLQIPISGNTMY